MPEETADSPQSRFKTARAALRSRGFGTVTAKVKSMMSPSLIQSAVFLAEEAKLLEQQHAGTPWGEVQEVFARHRSFVLGSLFSSVTFMEAAINEFISDATDTRQNIEESVGTDNTNWLSALWNSNFIRHTSVLDKYQIVLEGLGRPRFDKGRNPYQDVATVVRLRNELVHYKPEFLAGPESGHWTDSLRPKFAPNALFPAGSGNADFPGRLLGHGCAEWAAESSLSFADAFFAQIGVQPKYEQVRDRLKLNP